MLITFRIFQVHHLSKKHSHDMQSSWISFDTFAISDTNTSEPGPGWRMIAKALERKIDSIMATFSLILNETIVSNRELLSELRSRFLETNSTGQLPYVGQLPYNDHQRRQREFQRDVSPKIFEQNPANVHDSKDLMDLIRKFNANNINEYYRNVDKPQAPQNEVQFNGSIQDRMVKIYQDLDTLLKESSVEFGQNNKINQSPNQNTEHDKVEQNYKNMTSHKQHSMKTVVPDASEGKSFLNLYLKACQWTTISNPTSLPLCPCIPSQLGKYTTTKITM